MGWGKQERRAPCLSHTDIRRRRRASSGGGGCYCQFCRCCRLCGFVGVVGGVVGFVENKEEKTAHRDIKDHSLISIFRRRITSGIFSKMISVGSLERLAVAIGTEATSFITRCSLQPKCSRVCQPYMHYASSLVGTIYFN